MKAHYTKHFLKSYAEAPAQIQTAFDKQLKLLLSNFRHPSLQVKKYHETQGVWQARVTLSWRFYFTIEGDTYYLVEMKPHPKQQSALTFRHKERKHLTPGV
jgi:mRNA-degrading endonuclease RelE of RelBE toxin-antitoxin system